MLCICSRGETRQTRERTYYKNENYDCASNHSIEYFLRRVACCVCYVHMYGAFYTDGNRCFVE